MFFVRGKLIVGATQILRFGLHLLSQVSNLGSFIVRTGDHEAKRSNRVGSRARYRTALLLSKEEPF